MPREVIDPVIDPIEIQSVGEGPPPLLPEPPFGPDDDGNDDSMGPPVSNAYLGMLLFMGAEAMLFAGLIGAFLVFRFGSAVWPPPFQPRLPVGVTGVNTAILLLSGYTMYRARRAIQNGRGEKLMNGLLVTTLLGATFLSIQGYEWIRLLRFGLTLSSGTYGSTFYVLIGTHAAHVFGAMVWLLIVLMKVKSGRWTAKHQVRIELCGMYWYFVVGLWPVLYTLVYLN